jgi:hypothetical protein
MIFGVENRTSAEGVFLKSPGPTTNSSSGRIQQVEFRSRRKLHFELWEMEPEAGEDERMDLDLGLDQIEDMD